MDMGKDREFPSSSYKVDLQISVKVTAGNMEVVKRLVDKFLSDVLDDEGSLTVLKSENIGGCPLDENGKEYVRCGDIWYVPSCPYGYKDCIYDPEYVKAFHSPLWGGKCPVACNCEDVGCIKGDKYENAYGIEPD